MAISDAAYRRVFDALIPSLEDPDTCSGLAPLLEFLNGDKVDDFRPYEHLFWPIGGAVPDTSGMFRIEMSGRVPVEDMGQQVRMKFPIEFIYHLHPICGYTADKAGIYIDAVPMPDYFVPAILDAIVPKIHLGFMLKGYLGQTEEDGYWVEFAAVLSVLKMNMTMRYAIFLKPMDSRHNTREIDLVVEAINRSLVVGFSDGVLSRAIRERVKAEVLPKLMPMMGDVFKQSKLPEYSYDRVMRDMKKHETCKHKWPIVMMMNAAKRDVAVKPVTHTRQRVIEVDDDDQ